MENCMIWQDTARLDSDDIEFILERVGGLELCPGEVGSEESENFGYDKEVRRCLVAEVQDLDILDMCDRFFAEANSVMGVNYDRCSEIVYIEYHGSEDSSEAGFYDWHMDIEETKFFQTERKISMTIQLSDSDEYEGCDLEFGHVEPDIDQRERGTVIAFPSYFHHNVTPCTKGVRKCLVAWANGPLWR